MKISEIITDKYKLRMPPTVYYELLADVVEAEEEQEPKTGHWIKWYEQKEDDWVVENIPHCKCSECGTEYDPHSSQFIKYCNECGAKMVESQESEENNGN